MESNAIHRISALLSFYDHKKVVVMTRDYEKFTQHVISMLSGVSLEKICKRKLGVHDKHAVTDAVMAVQDAQLSLYHLDAKDDPDEAVAEMQKQNPDFILVDNSIPVKHQFPSSYLKQLPGIVILFNHSENEVTND